MKDEGKLCEGWEGREGLRKMSNHSQSVAVLVLILPRAYVDPSIESPPSRPTYIPTYSSSYVLKLCCITQ